MLMCINPTVSVELKLEVVGQHSYMGYASPSARDNFLAPAIVYWCNEQFPFETRYSISFESLVQIIKTQWQTLVYHMHCDGVGEDSMGQLERCFGPADAARRIRELRVLWISHMHADHHGGVYPLLLRREQLLQQQQQQQEEPGAGGGGAADGAAARAGGGVEPLLIIGPWPMFRVLQTYSKVAGFSFKGPVVLGLRVGFARLPIGCACRAIGTRE